MKKSQLIELLEEIEGDPDVCLDYHEGLPVKVDNVFVNLRGQIIIEP